MMSSISGVVAAIPERSMSAWERLLMSSDVHAKWTNSVTAWSSGFEAIRSLMTYSTALTSWFVVRSTFLTSAASAGEKFARKSSRNWFASSLRGGTSAICGMDASF
eukprot:30385-Pelagococcus_subviridis.AAC.1